MANNGDIDDSKEHGEVGLDADDNDTKDIIRLTAKDDDQWFYVPRNHAMIANLIKTSLESDAEAREITVPGRCSRPAVVVVVVAVLVLPPLMWCMGVCFRNAKCRPDLCVCYRAGVTAPILGLVVEYMNQHKGVQPPIVEKPLWSKVMADVCSDPWDAAFIDRVDEVRQTLYDLILAANYMDVKSLLHLGCAKVASLIKGQPLEKIKDILQADPLPPE